MHGEGVETGPDKRLSLTSQLVRLFWLGEPAVAVPATAAAKTRIDAVVDGLAWWLDRASSSERLHLLLDLQVDLDDEVAGALGSLVNALDRGPRIAVWRIAQDGSAAEIAMAAGRFSTSKPAAWAELLVDAGSAPIEGLAAELVEAVSSPAFALYPKLTSLASGEPWQMRLDGLEIGRVGAQSGTLRLASTKLDAPGEPRDTWRSVVGDAPRTFDTYTLPSAVAKIRELVEGWTSTAHAGSVLQHGQAEHALEAHVLSGRVKLDWSGGRLDLAVPFRNGMLGAAQFPTLWGVNGPARYLDALLRDERNRPWAIELKDQLSGGNGAYLRHGISQAVLYRHYIRNVEALDGWFADRDLLRTDCQAAVAFPTALAKVRPTIDSHRQIASLFGVEMLEFPRPGGS
jgi:hypothetical protein